MLCWFQENFESKRNLRLLYFGSKTSWSKHNCIKNILSSQVETCSKTSCPDVTCPDISSDLTFDPVQTLHTYTYSRYFRDTYETLSRQPQDTFQKNLHIHTCEVISYARKRWATGGQVGGWLHHNNATGSILLAGTCQIFNFAEDPRGSFSVTISLVHRNVCVIQCRR